MYWVILLIKLYGFPVYDSVIHLNIEQQCLFLVSEWYYMQETFNVRRLNLLKTYLKCNHCFRNVRNVFPHLRGLPFSKACAAFYFLELFFSGLWVPSLCFPSHFWSVTSFSHVDGEWFLLLSYKDLPSTVREEEGSLVVH